MGENEFDRIVYHTVGDQPLRGLDGTTYTYAVGDAAWEPVFTTATTNTTPVQNTAWHETSEDRDWWTTFNLGELRDNFFGDIGTIEVEPEPLTMDEIASLFEEG